MTCINFFTGAAGSQSNVHNLYSRLHYLHKARRHLETYLSGKRRSQATQSRGAMAGRSESRLRIGSIYDMHAESEEHGPISLSGPRLTIAPGDAQKQIEIIKLQVEVTTFLQTHGAYGVTAVQSGITLKRSSSCVRTDRPVTLFGRSGTRSAVVCQVAII